VKMASEQDLIIADMQKRGMVMDAQLSREHSDQVFMNQMLQEKDRTLSEIQLDLKDDLKMIENILRGYKEELDENTNEIRIIKPKDSSENILSDEGIKFIMDLLKFYTSKNHLLSAYDEETILNKCEDIGEQLNDELFMRSEIYFNVPDEATCKRLLLERLQKKKQKIIDTRVLLGQKYNEEKIWDKILNEIDVEKELEKIKIQKTNDLYKTFSLIHKRCLDFIESTYRRAMGGMERKTLRQHHSIVESKMPMNPNFNQQSRGGLFGWLKRR